MIDLTQHTIAVALDVDNVISVLIAGRAVRLQLPEYEAECLRAAVKRIQEKRKTAGA